jgi:hypothetical protein
MAKARVVYDMPEDEYRSGDHLSQSIANLLLAKSPRHAKLAMSRPRKPRQGMKRGTLIDEIMLGGNSIRVLDVERFQSNEAKALRDKALADGKVPVKRAEYDEAVVAASAIKGELADLGIVLNGHNQVSIFWEEVTLAGHVVQCRTRIDHLDLPRIYDLKTISSADDETCARHIDSYGYDVQAAAEMAAVERAFPEWAGRLEFVNIFVEVDEEPYLPNPVWQGPQTLAMGQEKWRRATEIWGRCQADNEWPGYSTGLRKLEAPPYALSRHALKMAEASEEAVNQW